MKQIIFIFMAILLATGMASAQKKAVIAADETSHDFGQIKEADGKVSGRQAGFFRPHACNEKRRHRH